MDCTCSDWTTHATSAPDYGENDWVITYRFTAGLNRTSRYGIREGPKGNLAADACWLSCICSNNCVSTGANALVNASAPSPQLPTLTVSGDEVVSVGVSVSIVSHRTSRPYPRTACRRAGRSMTR